MSMFSFFQEMEDAAETSSKGDFLKFGVVIVFLIGVLILSFNSTGQLPSNVFLAFAAVFAGYMALNIGANDVANNVGPAVGSKALTMGGAIIIAG
ncbi:MAG: inorganic phosphate transporter, partial [Gammaproteobacteria bacterium]|nr:inorganic phosphate transporter [Gammaproteobacteria bacterium]